MQAVSAQPLCKCIIEEGVIHFLLKFRQQVAQNKSHNWDVLMKRGFNEGCILFITEVRQNWAQLQEMFTPVST